MQAKMDEVQRLLEEGKIDEAMKLMEEMARSTQTRFILITHNPITMARMERLFGVTMAERGVSQLVSVDLKGAEAVLESKVASA